MPDNQSADKAYYASGNKSAINNDYVSSRMGKLDDPIVALHSPGLVHDDPSTDKYYREGGSRNSPTIPGRVVGPVGPVGHTGPVGPSGPPVRSIIVVATQQGVASCTEMAIHALSENAATTLDIQVATAEIEQNMRTMLELAVARERITADRYRDIKFSMSRPLTRAPIDNKLPPPDPAAVPMREEDEPLPDDLTAFVTAAAPVVAPIKPAAVAAVIDPDDDDDED